MHIEFLTYQFTFFVIAIGFCYFVKKLKRPDYFFILLLSTWLIISYAALYLYLANKVEYSIVTGFGGILIDRNNFAVHTVIFAFLVSVYSKNFRLTTLYTILSSIIIFYTGSITGVLACMVLIFYQMSKLKPQKRLLTGIVGAVILATILFIMRHRVWFFIEKLIDIFGGLFGSDTINSSISSRFWLIDQGSTLWGRFPFFGSGLGNTHLYIIKPGRWGQSGMNTHNNYLETLATSGIIGFLIHYGFLLFLLIAVFKHHKSIYIKYAIYMYSVISISFITTNHFITIYLFVFILFGTFIQSNMKTIDKRMAL
jgi:O-antigen ligase